MPACLRFLTTALGLAAVASACLVGVKPAGAQDAARPTPQFDLLPAITERSPPAEDARGTLDEDELPDAGEQDPSGDPTDPDANADPTEPPPPTAPRDGDLGEGTEARPTIDDGTPAPDPVQPRDGVEGESTDLRPSEDRVLFEAPPLSPEELLVRPDPDPLLFQIEDIDPVVTDRRPERLFLIEPYDPVGIRVGSFVFFPEIEAGGLATNNVRRSTPGFSDQALRLTADSRLVSNWNAHALELRAAGLLTYHDEFSTEDDRGYTLEARGRLDIMRRTNLQTLLSRDVMQESRSAIDATVAAGERPDITIDQANAALNHRFNRLSLQLRGGVIDYDIAGVETGGVFVSNNDRDVVTTNEAVRATWEFKPTFSVFSEVELNQRDFKAVSQSDLVGRDSTGERVRLGVDFGETSTFLRGEVGLGWARQSPDAASLDSIDAFLVDANLAWRVSELTSLLFTARTDIADTTSAGSAGVIQRQLGIEARHAFRRYVIASAGLSYTVQDYDATPQENTELTATLGLEYYINREFTLLGRYQHTDYDSTQPGSDYVADELRVGLRWRR